MSLVLMLVNSVSTLAGWLLVGWITYQAFLYYQTLLVTGKPNEWVVVMNGNHQRKAGIGISTVKGPYDTVAIFPSKVHKVSFTTTQISKELQGLEVTSMLVWTIYREEEGPMRAYRTLGEDLTKDNPVTANALMTSMASAFVRSCVANTGIEDVIKERDNFRATIIENLKP